MKVQIWGLYKDKAGNVWKAVENLQFGRWILRRQDKCHVTQMRAKDMAACMEYVGQSASEYVSA
jgi:hypothetical protein